MPGRLLAAACLVLLPAVALADTPRPVVTEIVTSESQRLRDFPGVIGAEVETAIGFALAGRIETRPVDPGDTVAAGDVLATLDRVTLMQDVAAAEAAVRAAQARAGLAAQTLSRVEELARRNVAPAAQVEAATANRDSTAAALVAANADLDRARDAAGNGILTAPADGVVLAVSAEPGSIVSAGASVVTLATDAGREAVIDVPSDMLAIIGTDARFTIRRRGEDAGAGTPGTLRLIEPVIGRATRSHRLHISLADPDGLRLGSLVTVSLDVPEDPVLTLPVAAILPDDAVWRVGDGRRLERVAVTTGAVIGERVVITSGIEAGDEILLRGIHSVGEGQQVGERVTP
ncbi:MAG: efflux RND transporter periplasmic adaptor subunit [Rubellimicrobium sp.]|nr:efflux RND transporter periplasmic adaptor subunit [Rubellimicrobium sp.]